MPNNIVGLNLARRHQPNFIAAAADIVNANGGAWGYADHPADPRGSRLGLRRTTLQQLLDRCFEARLQPIVRVATRFDEETGIWDRPTEDEPGRWRWLFEQVRWPNRLVWVIPANEPNLGREWGGQVDVASYAHYLELFMNMFAGAESDRFQVVNAPLNLSNPHQPPEMQDAFEFLAEHMALDAERLRAAAGLGHQLVPGGRLRRGPPLHPPRLRGRAGGHRARDAGDRHRVRLPTATTRPMARFFVQAYKDWQADRRVIAATPLIWDPDFDDHWMFTLDRHGKVETDSPTYRALRELPRVAGSPEAGPPLGNTGQGVSAGALRSKPLPIFLPDPQRRPAAWWSARPRPDPSRAPLLVAVSSTRCLAGRGPCG